MKGLPLKDELIEATAEEVQLKEDVVYSVIDWVYKDTKEASQIYNELELSGFGKLIVSKPKLKRRIKRMEDIKHFTAKKLEASPTERWEKRLLSAENKLLALNQRNNEPETDI